MSELTTEMLRTLEPQDLAALLPAPVQIGDRTGMVLRLADTDLVELFHAGTISFVSTNVLQVEPITDPVLLEDALRTAVEGLTICRRVSIEAHAEQRQAHATKLEAIRDYAIEAHEDGSICRDGLDSFLAAFEFEPYRTRVKVEYTISGSYEVDHSSIEAAEDDAQHYLKPDLCELDEVDTDSSSYDVQITTVTEL